MKFPIAKIVAVLDALGSKDPGGEGKWVQGSCPLAPWTHKGGKDSNPSFGVSKDRGVANCFSCGFKGSLFVLAAECSRLKQQSAKSGKCDPAKAFELLTGDDLDLPTLELKPYEEVAPPPFVEFTDWWWKQFPDLNAGTLPYNYLLGRGVTLEQMQRFDIKWDPHRSMVVWPIRTFNGVLAGARGRAYKPAGPGFKHHSYAGPGGRRNEMILGNESALDPMKTVVVVEGHFDLAIVDQLYRNVCCTMTASLNPAKISRLAAFPRIVTFFDPGTGGDTGRDEMSTHFPPWKIQHIVHTGPEDANELGVARVANYLDAVGIL